MYPRNSLAPFSAPHRVAVSTSQPPSPHSPDAAQLLSLDCVACISLGCEQHLRTTATSSHRQPAAPNFQQHLTSSARACSSLHQNCEPLTPLSLNLPPTKPHPHLRPPLTSSPVLPPTSDRPRPSSVGFIFSGPFQPKQPGIKYTCEHAV